MTLRHITGSCCSRTPTTSGIVGRAWVKMKLSDICTAEMYAIFFIMHIRQQGFVVSIYESQYAPTGTECKHLCSKGLASLVLSSLSLFRCFSGTSILLPLTLFPGSSSHESCVIWRMHKQRPYVVRQTDRLTKSHWHHQSRGSLTLAPINLNH